MVATPASLSPADVEMSCAEAITLPYLETHFTEFGPASPLRSIPLGKIQRLVAMSDFQSIDLPVITSSFAPRQTTRVHALAYMGKVIKATVALAPSSAARK